MLESNQFSLTLEMYDSDKSSDSKHQVDSGLVAQPHWPSTMCLLTCVVLQQIKYY